MDSKEMKNIKKPTYALLMGTGLFAGASKWICTKCGKQATMSGSSMPPPQWNGKCPDTASGNHVWQQA